MHEAAWAKLDTPAEYFRIEIPLGQLEKAVPLLVQAGLNGWNCTLPHKIEMFRLTQVHDPTALQAESVNTVQIVDGKIHGWSTDAGGWSRAMSEAWPHSVPPGRTLILGCGGVGQSIARHLAHIGCQSLTLVNRDPKRAQILLHQITPLVASRFPLQQVNWNPSSIQKALSETDLLVHGTTLGMKSDDPLPISKEWMNPPLRVYDTLYKKDFTPLVQAARERGCHAEDGLAMLLHQGALSFAIWAKKPAPLDSMRTALNLVTGRNL